MQLILSLSEWDFRLLQKRIREINSPATKVPQLQTPAQRSAGTSNHKLLLNGSQDFHLRGLNAKVAAMRLPLTSEIFLFGCKYGISVRRTRDGTPPNAEFIPAANALTSFCAKGQGKYITRRKLKARRAEVRRVLEVEKNHGK